MEKRRINIRAVILNNGKLLAVKHKTKDGGESDYWAVPGGGLDPFESLTDGLKRELVEETGIVPKLGRLLFVQQFRSRRKGYEEELEFFFSVTNPEDYTHIDLEKTTHGMQEIARCEFIDPTTELILPEILHSQEFYDTVNNGDANVIVHTQL